MRVRSIPPITSTGSNKRKTPVHPGMLAHMSIGRYMSEMAKNKKAEEDHESWDITKYTKSDVTRKSKKKTTTSGIYVTERKIDCIVEMFDDYSEKVDFAIKLTFNGLVFSGDTFERIDSDNGACGYFIPVWYQQQTASLVLTTIGDIFEYEVVGHKGVNRIFSDEVYIPKLLQTYDSLSMNVILKDDCVIVNYKKNEY